MAVNKVIYKGETLIDLSGDTLTSADQLAEGVIAHDKNGEPIVGTMIAGSGGGIETCTVTFTGNTGYLSLVGGTTFEIDNISSFITDGMLTTVVQVIKNSCLSVTLSSGRYYATSVTDSTILYEGTEGTTYYFTILDDGTINIP